MELTEKQQAWLEQLVFEGQVTAELSILNDKVKVTLTSITGEKQLAAERTLGDAQGAAIFVAHSYAIELLSQTLKAYSTAKTSVKFDTVEKAAKFIKDRSAVIVDALIKAQSDFEKELKEITLGEKLSENFSLTPGTDVDSNITPKV
jgi:hypothetical protein